jgi:hypothetical protein
MIAVHTVMELAALDSRVSDGPALQHHAMTHRTVNKERIIARLREIQPLVARVSIRVRRDGVHAKMILQPARSRGPPTRRDAKMTTRKAPLTLSSKIHRRRTVMRLIVAAIALIAPFAAAA